MAQLSKGVTLAYGAYGASGVTGPKDATYTTLADMQEFPDLLGEPETVDVTTLENDFRHYIPGIRDVGGNMGFTFLYTKTGFAAANGITGHSYFRLTIPDENGATGTSGAMNIYWAGYAKTSLQGKGVNDAMQFQLNVVPDEDFVID